MNGWEAMAVMMKCPNLGCRKILKVPEELRGKRVNCSYCKRTLLVPISYFGEKKKAATGNSK